jgi:serine/threonine protein kinase
MPVHKATHPSTETLQALALGQLEDAGSAAVLRHLLTCPECCRKASELPGCDFLSWLRDASSHGVPPPPGPALPELPTVLPVPQVPHGQACGRVPESLGANGKVRWSPEQLPAPFGRYQILELLGEGGMGAVYRAHDSQLDRPVALKIPFFRDGNPDLRERFLREARLAATLNHPNICPVHDVGQINGVHYLSMAFVEGKPLARVLHNRALSPPQVVGLVRKIALALGEAHKRGVIHRDLKPANVMITWQSEPIVMDFGLARRYDGKGPRLTQLGSVLGTPEYMAPEQACGRADKLGPACDIYSLGVILYEMLAGRLPFVGDTVALLAQVLCDEPKPPSAWRSGVDPALEAICLKAMAKLPSRRFLSMAEFAAAVAERLKVPERRPAK